MALSIVFGALAVGAVAVLLTLGAVKVDAEWERLDDPEDLQLDPYTCRVLYKAISDRVDELTNEDRLTGLLEALDIIYEAMHE